MWRSDGVHLRCVRIREMRALAAANSPWRLLLISRGATAQDRPDVRLHGTVLMPKNSEGEEPSGSPGRPLRRPPAAVKRPPDQQHKSREGERDDERVHVLPGRGKNRRHPEEEGGDPERCRLLDVDKSGPQEPGGCSGDQAHLCGVKRRPVAVHRVGVGRQERRCAEAHEHRRRPRNDAAGHDEGKNDARDDHDDGRRLNPPHGRSPGAGAPHHVKPERRSHNVEEGTERGHRGGKECQHEDDDEEVRHRRVDEVRYDRVDVALGGGCKSYHALGLVEVDVRERADRESDPGHHQDERSADKDRTVQRPAVLDGHEPDDKLRLREHPYAHTENERRHHGEPDR